MTSLKNHDYSQSNNVIKIEMEIKDLRRGTIRNPLRNGFKDRVMISRFAPSTERQNLSKILAGYSLKIFYFHLRVDLQILRERKVEQE